MEIPQKIQNRTTIWLSSPTFHIYIQWKWNQYLEEIAPPPCSMQHVHEWVKMDKEDVVHIHNGITTPLKRRKCCHWQQHGGAKKGIVLNEMSTHRKTNTTWSHSYVKFRIVKLLEAKSSMAVAGGGEVGSCGSQVQSLRHAGSVSRGDPMCSTGHYGN